MVRFIIDGVSVFALCVLRQITFADSFLERNIKSAVMRRSTSSYVFSRGFHGLIGRRKCCPFSLHRLDESRYMAATHHYSRRYCGTAVKATSHGEELDHHLRSEKVISSVRESLRENVVKPHLGINTSRIDSSLCSANDGNTINSTLVMLLGVSGGCDSVALFHSVIDLIRLEDPTNHCSTNTTSSSNMHALRYLYLDSEDMTSSNVTKRNDMFRISCELHVAHFNHEQRGENSDADEALVKRLCSEAGIPFHSYSWSEIKSGSILETSTFSQDVARKWRRKKMIELLKTLVTNTNKVNADDSHRWGAILTAHHRDDADETMLLKLLRGAHLTNLSGMEHRSSAFELQASHKASSSVGYFAKPLLGVRKQDIVDYLTSNNLEWREDESNSENKYKRNKVRNQLIPLLSEIAGGEDALHKRLYNLEQQSKELSQDLTQRAEDYLASMSTESSFLLPNEFNAFNIVLQQAVHLWAAKATNFQLILSYDQMQRIKNQFDAFPTRLQWNLDVGDCWTIGRNGQALTVSKKEGTKNKERADVCSNETASNPWKILPTESTGESTHVHELNFGNLPQHHDMSQVRIKQVKDVSYLTFVPPWRKGRGAVKIKEFLRGQKVPLHNRDDAYVLCCSYGSSEYALAIYLEERDQWVLHSDFAHEKGPIVKVTLCKTL